MPHLIPRGLGWIPDLPDPRDYTLRHKSVLLLLDQLKQLPQECVPDFVDLRCDDEGKYFTQPEDQGPIRSSAAFSVLSLVEYFERRTRGRAFRGSKRFLYKVTRNLRQRQPIVGHIQHPAYLQQSPTISHSIGDTGADLRTTLQVLATIGVPSEEIWPYDVERFDDEPSSFAYSAAKPLTGVRYFRLDAPNDDGTTTWDTVISFLAAGFPVVFGFAVPDSIALDADVPFRAGLDSISGGQAVVAVGYKHNHDGRGQHALLIRSSWGSQWGDHGYGWLPMAFLQKQVARDFWTIISDDWLNATELSRPFVCQRSSTAIE